MGERINGHEWVKDEREMGMGDGDMGGNWMEGGNGVPIPHSMPSTSHNTTAITHKINTSVVLAY